MTIIALFGVLVPCLALALSAPVVQLSATMVNSQGHVIGDSVYVHLSWSAVPGASRYRVEYRSRLTETPQIRGFTIGTTFDVAVPTGWALEDPVVLGFFTVRSDSCDQAIPERILVPAGPFRMGQVGVMEPEHDVQLTYDFELGRTEVTNQQFLDALNWANELGFVTLVGDQVQQFGVDLFRIGVDFDYYEIHYDALADQFYLDPGTADRGEWGPGQAYPAGYDPASHPMTWLSWYGAACYCDWLSLQHGLPAYYQGQWDQIPSPRDPTTAQGYRLPTEAEWEYAAQFADERMYPWGASAPTCAHADCFLGTFCIGWSSPVGSHPLGATSLGFEDMAGNVWEWCNDWSAEYASEGVVNPVGPATGVARIQRGGSWYGDAVNLPCAHRIDHSPFYTDHFNGVRICRTLP